MRKFICCILAATTFFVGAASSCSLLQKTPASENSISESVQEKEYALSLKKTLYKLEDGQTATLQLNFTVDGVEADWSLLTFSSSDDSVVTVSADGVMTGVAGGKANVTVTDGTNTVSATVNVVMRTYKIKLSTESLILPIGESAQVTATAYFGSKEEEGAALSWQSSNPDVATVEDGLITVVNSGNAEISVSYQGVTESVDVLGVVKTTAENVNSFSEEYINIYGRSYVSAGDLHFDHAANAVELGMFGASLSVSIYATADSYMRVYVDGSKTGKRLTVTRGTADYTAAEDLEEGYHTIRIVKASEEQNAQWAIRSFTAEEFFVVPEKSDLKIEFIGDSITAGYGVLGATGVSWSVENSDCAKSYAYLAAEALNADYSIVAWSGICTKAYYWASGLNMETLYGYVSSTNRQTYAADFDADVVVLNLGTNEGSYISSGLPNAGSYGMQFPADYKAFLQAIRAKNPNAYIICLYGMMGRNVAIQTGIQMAIEELGDEKVAYNPFTFEPNTLAANGHPSSMAQKNWADALAEYIRTIA
ncbi:MAG: Ig-like domain-containing protein [Clostridia bacterium]|nr:Ig-like domain-containing protein [Clostridia bacterium]